MVAAPRNSSGCLRSTASVLALRVEGLRVEGLRDLGLRVVDLRGKGYGVRSKVKGLGTRDKR
jgi:hypothetical protein